MEKLLRKLTEIEESTKCNTDKQDAAYIRLQCVRILQQIGEKLLTEYYIQVGDFKINPLRVEAYYFNTGNFEDCSTYGRDEQMKYNYLFLHGPEIGYEGVDICIGNGKAEKSDGRYLSFLIKDSIVTKKGESEGVYCKQTALYCKLKNECETSVLENVLQKKPKTNIEIFHTVRKGLSGKPFGRELLGSLIPVEEKQITKEFIEGKDEEKKDKKYNEYKVKKEVFTIKGISFYDYEPGFGAIQTIAQYLRDHPEKNIEENWKKWWKGGFPGWAKNWNDELDKRRNHSK